MKITCNVIRDLLPLYAENIANEDTRDLIEEHLKQCESCMKKLQQMEKTQTIPNALENEFIDNLKNKFTRIALNIILVIVAFLASMNLVSVTSLSSIGFMEFGDLNYNFQTAYTYQMTDDMVYYNLTIDDLGFLGVEEFDENNVIDEKLSLWISGENNFQRSHVTKVKPEGSDKYIYYIEAYKNLSSNKVTNYHFFHEDDNNTMDANTKSHYDDYIGAIYVATPTKDYLIYGEDIATEKFEVTYPFLGVHIFTLVIIVLSIVCSVLRVCGNKSSIDKYIDVVSIIIIFLLLTSMLILRFL